MMMRSVFEIVKAPMGWTVYADNVKIGGVYNSRGAAWRLPRWPHDAFFADRRMIPDAHSCEVRFEELEADPAAAVDRIYDQLRLPGFDEFSPKFTVLRRITCGLSKERIRAAR